MPEADRSETKRRSGLLLRAIREFRRRSGRPPHGAVASGGVARAVRVLGLAWRLRHASRLNLGGGASARTCLVMVDEVTPHSKAATLVAALGDHGLPPERILHPRRAHALARLGFKLAMLRAALRLSPWRRKLPADDLALIAAALAHGKRFAGAKTPTLHMGDRSPRRIALATGAALANRPALYWQNGFHDRAVPDLGYTHAAVLNAKGEQAFAGRATRVWAIEISDKASLRLPDRIERLGLATNAFADAELDATCAALRAAFPEADLALRLHPRVSGLDPARVPGWDVRPRGESLEAFARAQDAVICGNTAAQIETLVAGTPVIHIPGLDPHGFDLYGYAARGISFGVETLPTPEVVTAMGAFYEAPGWRARLFTEVTPPSAEVPSLRRLVETLLAQGG